MNQINIIFFSISKMRVLFCAIVLLAMLLHQGFADPSIRSVLLNLTSAIYRFKFSPHPYLLYLTHIRNLNDIYAWVYLKFGL